VLWIAEMVTLIVGAQLPAGSIFADRYRIESPITHSERKWTYIAGE
jgi:hypothetical protein